MPKNNIPQRSSKNSDHPMNKNLFVFKFAPLPPNLDNDPSVMRHQFHLKFDKNGKLGDLEPIYKSSKKRSSRSKSTRPTTRQPTYGSSQDHTDTPTSEVTPSLYHHASSPIFFTSLSPQTTNTRNRTSPAILEKIKISNLVNEEMIDEKELDLSTIQALAETFKAPRTPLETELSMPKLW